MIERNFAGYCPNCGCQRRFVRTSGDQMVATGLFLAITLGTCGLGLPIAIVVALAVQPKPKCIVCGGPLP